MFLVAALKCLSEGNLKKKRNEAHQTQTKRYLFVTCFRHAWGHVHPQRKKILTASANRSGENLLMLSTTLLTPEAQK